VTPSARILHWHYIVGAAFTGHVAASTAAAGSWWHAAGLFVVSLLLMVALGREYIAADQRRAAERAARMRAWQNQARADMERGCCERWWTSIGEEHDTTHCARKDQAA
jgi:membrane protein implicated in regulation of membrane protease activity